LLGGNNFDCEGISNFCCVVDVRDSLVRPQLRQCTFRNRRGNSLPISARDRPTATSIPLTAPFGVYGLAQVWTRVVVPKMDSTEGADLLRRNAVPPRLEVEGGLTYGARGPGHGLPPNGCAERRARCCMNLTLYLPPVRSSEVLGGNAKPCANLRQFLGATESLTLRIKEG
jgi:hypothetical protein